MRSSVKEVLAPLCGGFAASVGSEYCRRAGNDDSDAGDCFNDVCFHDMY
jgi:hypothetical protein